MTNSCFGSRRKKNAKVLCLWLLLFVLAPAHAIVVRHDTGYTRYIAREADYPAVFPLEQQGRRKVCVATLIAPHWALTAAHCTRQTALLATLAQGERYPVTIGRQQRFVDAAYVHPDWSEERSDELLPARVDLALLRLSAPVTDIAPLALYRGGCELGRVMTFLGWGFTGIGTTGMAVTDGRLRFAHNTVTRADSRLRFQFNAPGAGSDTLEFEGIPALGDSGGPALLSPDGEPLLAGIAIGELGRPTAERRGGRYGAVVVYERISRHLQWIDAIVDAEETTKEVSQCQTHPG